MTEQNNKTEEKLYTMLKLDRSKRRWRLFSLLLIIIVAVMFFSKDNMPKKQDAVSKEYIANIKIEGVILEDDYRLKRLEELKDDENAKAVILTIDSPGGAMVPGFELLESLKEIADKKPLVVQMKTIAASAGYLISLSGEYVVANKASLTGSVGVLMPLVDATELAKKVGIKSAEITSGDLKSITSPIAERSNKAQDYLQTTVNDLQKIFMAEVKSRREISPETESLISDGRVLIGQQAYEVGLIDAVGGKKLLVSYLQEVKKLSKDLEVEEYSLEEPEKVKFQDILADQLTSMVSTKLDTILNSKIVTPVM
tara:strand:+ start:249 stop:1184 length:936 start_codon:yes stop_codon:yes gene_type:complete